MVEKLLKLFMLGAPGSGKSTSSRYIIEMVNSNNKENNLYEGRLAKHISDYPVLEAMSRNVEYHQDFEHLPSQGFRVKNLKIYDIALRGLEARTRATYLEGYNFIVIECARYDYLNAFKQLSKFIPNFLEDSAFIFLKAKIDNCVVRVEKRITEPPTEDNHYVSDKTFQLYRHHLQEHPGYLIDLETYLHRISSHVRFIDNNGSQQDCQNEILRVVKDFAGKSVLV